MQQILLQRLTGQQQFSSARLLLGLFTVLDYVAPGKENPLKCLAKSWFLTENEFEIHSEMFELLLLRILHDRLGLGILFQRYPLLLPVDRLSFLDRRREHARESACLLGKLFWWFVILFCRHVFAPLGKEKALP